MISLLTYPPIYFSRLIWKEVNRSISRRITKFSLQLWFFLNFHHIHVKRDEQIYIAGNSSICITVVYFFTIPSGPSMMKQPGNTTDLVALQTERGSQLVHYWRTKRCTCENRNRSKSRGFPILASQLFLLTF